MRSRIWRSSTMRFRYSRIAGPSAIDFSCFHGSKMKPSVRSEEHTSELQSLMRISYAVFCLKKKKIRNNILLRNTLLYTERKYRQHTYHNPLYLHQIYYSERH